MTGLVGWWPLHEDSGNTAYDLSGNENHGSLNGGVTQGVAGKGGLTAYSFDGSDDYIYTDVTSLPETFTFCLWVKIDSSADDATHFLSVFNSTSQDVQIRWQKSSDEWSFAVDRGENLNSNAGSLDEWHHLVFVADSSSGQQIWEDGSLVASTSTTWSGNHEPGGNVELGRLAGDNDDWMHGKMCDARVYDRALNPEEIQALYEQGSGDFTTRGLSDGSDSGAVSRWKFDNLNNDTNTAEDFWGSNNGAVNGASYVSDSIRGKSMNFNGSGNTLEGSLGSYSEFTASLWTYIDDDSSDSYVLWGDKNDGSSSSYGAPMIRINNGNLKFFGRADLNYSRYYTKGWAHIVYTASDTDYYYFNGSVVGETSTSGAVDWNDLLLGNRPGNSSYFDGKIDDFRLYNRALSPSEVFELYQWGTRGRDLRKQLVNSRGL